MGGIVQVHFHVGPHKTGTSSIQFLLRSRYGSDDPKPIWYPKRTFLGATGGHSRIADQFRPLPHLYAPLEGLRQLQNLIDEARSVGVEKLILSSENFSFASAADLKEIRALFPDQEFHLILAATPIVKRLRSQWSTRVLNGEQTQIEDALAILPRLPGLQGNYYSKMVDSLTPSSATLIVIRPEDRPEYLLTEFLSVCGLNVGELSPAELSPKNTSLDHYQSQLLIRFNELYEQSAQTQPDKINSSVPIFNQKEYLDIRIALVKVFRSDAWKIGMGTLKLDTPLSLRPTLREIADAHRTSIDALVADRRLNVVGDLDMLHEGLDG